MKTARMIAVAAEMGGILGGATRRQRTALRKYGFYVGRAFQVQDDLLDITADEEAFGKRIGGDVVEGKKTFLLLRAMERARGKDRSMLMRVVRKDRIGWNEIPAYRDIFAKTGAIDDARRLIARDIRLAQDRLDALPPSDDREMLRWFSELLRERLT
jgi:geranylgeranyl diphosphate synthase type II